MVSHLVTAVCTKPKGVEFESHSTHILRLTEKKKSKWVGPRAEGVCVPIGEIGNRIGDTQMGAPMPCL